MQIFRRSYGMSPAKAGVPAHGRADALACKADDEPPLTGVSLCAIPLRGRQNPCEDQVSPCARARRYPRGLLQGRLLDQSGLPARGRADAHLMKIGETRQASPRAGMQTSKVRHPPAPQRRRTDQHFCSSLSHPAMQNRRVFQTDSPPAEGGGADGARGPHPSRANPAQKERLLLCGPLSLLKKILIQNPLGF